MKGTLYLLDELDNIVQGEARFEIAEVASRYLECLLPARASPTRQSASQGLVDDLAEGSAGTARFCFQLGRHIIIQGKCSSHT